jgi:DNA-binding ferritin-like protein
MRREELVAQLESAKALTSVVSIDNVIALIQQLEETKIVTRTEFRLTHTMFEKIMDTVTDAVDDLRDSQIVELDSAEFEINYNNQVELTNIQVDREVITDAIRDEIDRCFEILDDEEEGVIVDVDPQKQIDGFIEAQIEAEQASQEE